MSRTRMFTSDVIARILDWRDRGLGVSEIADKIGCTSGTLRVRCSQLGISLRGPARLRTSPTLVCSAKHDPVRTKVPTEPVVRPSAITSRLKLSSQSGSRSAQIEIKLLLSEIVMEQLRHRAALMGVDEVTLAAMLLDTIVSDDLFGAILQD